MGRLTRQNLRKRVPEYRLFGVIIALVIIGIIFLSSASSVISFTEYNDSRYMFLKQVFGIFVGFIFMWIFYKVDVTFWKKWALPLLILSVVALIAVFIPFIGVEHGGARRWIDIGPIQLQPSEFLKFSIIIYLATLFEKKGSLVKEAYHGLLPFLALVTLMGILLITQPDMGTLIILISIAGVMYFVSGAKTSHIASVLALGIVAFMALIKMSPYRMQRFLVFLNPNSYVNHEAGYQTQQALIAIGSGGLWGVGFGKSLQKYQYLPEAATDSIFAIISEERGMIGAVIVVSLFVAFGFFGFKIAKRTTDVYTRLVVVGITGWIVAQATLNIAAALSMVPLTGVTLPFISFGGTSIVMAIAMSGILLNVSRDTKERTESENSHSGRRNRRSRSTSFGDS